MANSIKLELQTNRPFVKMIILKQFFDENSSWIRR